MMQPKTKPVFNSNFPSHIIACTSDRSVDFTMDSRHPKLSDPQKEHLREMVGIAIPEPASLIQEHGKTICFVENGGTLQAGDGLITSSDNCPLAVRSADCLPVFLWDEGHDAIGLAHAGWKGSKGKVAANAVDSLRGRFGTRPEDIKAAFGPSICAKCYRVGEEFREYFPEDCIVRDNEYFLDLADINKNQLVMTGIPEKNIFMSDVCTCCSKEYFSYRREGEKACRMISIMMIDKK